MTTAVLARPTHRCGNIENGKAEWAIQAPASIVKQLDRRID